MKISSQDWRRILPGVLVSLISLGIVFYLADPKRLIEAVRLADYRFVSLVFLITLVWLSIRSQVWRTILKERATYSQVFFTINEGYLLNNLLPFRLGEVGRAFLLGRKAHLPFFNVFSTIIIERALDMAFAAGLLLSTLSFVVGSSWAKEAALLTAGLVLVGLLVLYLLARYRDWATRQLEKLHSRWRLLERLFQDFLPSFLNGLGVLTEGKRFLCVVAWMTLNWLVAVFQSYVVLRAFFPEAQILWAAFLLGVTSLGIAAPSSPGAVGVFELSFVGALALFGLDPSVSLAAAFTAHLSNYLVTGVIGIYALLQDGLTLTGLYKNVREISSNQGAG